MKRILFSIVVLTTSLFFLSCNQTTTPSESQKSALTASENPISIALNSTKGITVTGGQGSYHVKSMTDSGIVGLAFYSQNRGTTTFSQYVEFSPKKLGTTKVIIQDSAKAAEVEIIVTIAVMVSTPSAISVKTQQTKSAYISGGTYPHRISVPSNSSVATVTISGSSLQVTGVSQGATNVTVSDNANPANVLTIPITVTIPPSFTTAGKISFSSTKGDFVTEGIYAATNINDLPTNDAGAGGFVTKYISLGNIGEIIGYKKKTPPLMDIVLFIFYKNSITPGTVSLDSGSTIAPREMGNVIFGFDLTPYNQTNPAYATFSGSIIFSTLNEQIAEGSFSGKASLFSNQSGTPVPGSDVTISQGLFSVPLIVDEGSYSSITNENQMIFNQIEKTAKPYVDKMRNRIETLRKR